MNIKQTDEPGGFNIVGQENTEAQQPIAPSAEAAMAHRSRCNHAVAGAAGSSPGRVVGRTLSSSTIGRALTS